MCGTFLLFHGLLTFCCALVPLLVSLPSEESTCTTHPVLHSLSFRWCYLPAHLFNAWHFSWWHGGGTWQSICGQPALLWSLANGHICAFHRACLLRQWFLSLADALVACLVSFSPEEPPANATLHLPTLLYMLLVLLSSVVTFTVCVSSLHLSTSYWAHSMAAS